MSFPGITITEGPGSARILVRDLMRVPEHMRREIRPALRDAARPIFESATARAGAWSSRIPGAMRMRVSFSQTKPGVYITVSSKAAPHARPYEGLSGGSTFRHPTYGGDPWVSQETRPSLMPALDENEGRAYTVIREAVEGVLRRFNLL